jgi:hypothetical protein
MLFSFQISNCNAKAKKHLETFKLKIEQHEMENRKTAWIFINIEKN